MVSAVPVQLQPLPPSFLAYLLLIIKVTVWIPLTPFPSRQITQVGRWLDMQAFEKAKATVCPDFGGLIIEGIGIPNPYYSDSIKTILNCHVQYGTK